MRLTRFALVCAVAIAAALPIGFSAAARSRGGPQRSAPKRSAPPAAEQIRAASIPPTVAASLPAPARVRDAKAARALKPMPRPMLVAEDVRARKADVDRPGRPRSMQERFQEEMEATSRGAQKNEARRSQGGWEQWFYGQRAFPASSIPAGAMQNALAQAVAHNGGLHGGPGDTGPPGGGTSSPTWVPIGPGTIPNGQTDTSVGPANPVSGRVSAIEVDPTNSNIVYVGGAQGGVWKTTNADSANPTWTPLTDSQPSLAIGDIKVDPVNHNIIYVGTGEPNGSCDSYYGAGVLRSTDGGVTWKQFGSDPGGPFLGQSISRILIDPATAGSATTTTVWASTALGFTSSGTAQCGLAPGAWNGAVWRSMDSGNTWQLQDVPTGAAAPNARIHDMVLDPTNSNTLYVAVRSVPTPANGGVWKSTNAKGSPATFTKLAGFPDTTTASPGIRRITLAIGGPTAPGTVYAALESVQSSLLWGIFKTINGGTTWSHLQAATGAATFAASSSGTAVTATSGTFATDGSWIGRRMIFAGFHSGFIDSVTDSTHLHLSNQFTFSGAGTWSVGSYPSFCDGQCFYDMTVGVDPTDATGSRVYVGGNPSVFVNSGSQAGASSHFLWRSTDGGATWTAISQGSGTSGGIHTDDHAIAFDSSVTPARIFDGDDGGIFRSDDQGASWVHMNTNVAITQFQSVSTNPFNPNIVIGGTQDNGTNILNPAFQPPPAWFHTDFGDGGQAVMDQSNPNRMLHTYFNQAFNFMGPSKALDGGINGPGPTIFGGSWDFVGAYYGYGSQYYNGLDPTAPVSFYAPLRLHPAFAPNAVYFGSNRLYRASDPQPTALAGPASWTVKSPALVSSTPGANFLSAIGVLPTLVGGKEVLYVGAADGRVSASSNVDSSGSLATWSAFNGGCPGTPTGPLPCRFVTDINVPASDPTGNTAYVSFSGFNVNTPGQPGHLFRTVNGLSGSPTFTNISGDLPDTPVNAIVVDPTHTPAVLYAGTDIGVFQSVDDGMHWNYLSTGHPVVSVFGLERNARTGQIISSTHGRGMFQLNSDGFPDTTPPVCGGSISGPGQFTGTALDAGANDTGIASIALTVGSSNLVVSSITNNGPGSATYVVTTINHDLPGSGIVRTTDFAGNFCETTVSIPAGTPFAGFFTLTPCRVEDTRSSPAGPITVGVDQTFFVAGVCGIPADATAISTNVTVTQSTASGDLKVFAGGTTVPIPPVIVYSGGQTRANNAMIRLGTGSTITVHVDQVSGNVQFILDVNGFYK
ncbi:MAG TPA: hypothetical protein VKE50_02660 [Thermoanaerobaculia bacterium]|nr:hypothetical protein [Thermoanaerobaculia bacterium]